MFSKVPYLKREDMRALQEESDFRYGQLRAGLSQCTNRLSNVTGQKGQRVTYAYDITHYSLKVPYY